MGKDIPKRPKWLKEIQNNSWNPELLISGLSLVFLFSIDNQLSEKGIEAIQLHALNPTLVYLVAIYLSAALATLKWTFAAHLILRGIWVGWVGLNYVFPAGIIFEKLPKMSRQEYVKRDLGNPTERVLLLERACSSIFGLAFTLVGVSLYIIAFVLVAFVLEKIGVGVKISLLIVAITFALISIIVPLNYILSKWKKVEEIGILSKTYHVTTKIYSVLFFRESLLTYQTNLKKITFYGALIILTFLFGELSSSYLINMERFIGQALTKSSIFPITKYEGSIPDEFVNNFYEDRNEDNSRIHKASIPSFQIDADLLEVFVPYYKWDSEIFDEIAEHDTSTFEFNQLVTLRVDTLDQEVSWYRTKHASNGQKGWIAHLPIYDLGKGEKVLYVDKWIWDYEKKESVFRKNYCSIPFWKN